MDKVETKFTSAQKVIDKIEFSFASVQNKIVELSLYSTHTYRDPFRDVELDVVFSNQDGTELRVPAFWAGENTWKARFSSHPALSAVSAEFQDALPEWLLAA